VTARNHQKIATDDTLTKVKVDVNAYSSYAIASPLRELMCWQSYMASQCHLPPGRGGIPTTTYLRQLKLVLDSATPEGCKA